MRFFMMPILALAVCSMPAVAAPQDVSAIQDLHGTYYSPKVEEWYGGFGTREFVFSDGHWSLTFTHALDPQMTMRTFQFRTGGGYKVMEESAAVPNAYHTVFDEDWKHLTVLTDDASIIQGMGLAACGLTFNLEADISVEGCGNWRPVSECGVDHDIVSLSKDGVQFGVRPNDNDMCTEDKMPTALLPAVVVR